MRDGRTKKAIYVTNLVDIGKNNIVLPRSTLMISRLGKMFNRHPLRLLVPNNGSKVVNMKSDLRHNKVVHLNKEV